MLLSLHPCVVIPGVGALVREVIPAHYDAEAQAMTPPVCEIRFNSELTHDDGLLVTSLCRREGLQHTQALHQIRSWAVQPELQIGRIGTINRSEDHPSAVFTPCNGSIVTAPFEALPTVARPAAEEIDTDSPIVAPTRRSRAWVRYAAMLAGGVTLIGVTLLSPQMDLGQVARAALFRLTPSQSQPQAPVLQPVKMVSGNLFIAKPKAEEAPAIAPVPAKPEKGFAVVVASYYTKEEALKHIAQAKNPALHYLGIGKYHRVVIAETDNYRDAYLMALKLDSQYPGAWALRK